MGLQAHRTSEYYKSLQDLSWLFFYNWNRKISDNRALINSILKKKNLFYQAKYFLHVSVYLKDMNSAII